jgi:hypothetical protein
MASGHMNRVKRPDTWLHRPMLQNVKKALANPEPSTHDPSLPFGDQYCCVAHQRILFHDLGTSEHAVRLRLWSKEARATCDRYSAALRKTASRVASR